MLTSLRLFILSFASLVIVIMIARDDDYHPELLEHVQPISNLERKEIVAQQRHSIDLKQPNLVSRIGQKNSSELSLVPNELSLGGINFIAEAQLNFQLEIMDDSPNQQNSLTTIDSDNLEAEDKATMLFSDINLPALEEVSTAAPSSTEWLAFIEQDEILLNKDIESPVALSIGALESDIAKNPRELEHQDSKSGFLPINDNPSLLDEEDSTTLPSIVFNGAEEQALLNITTEVSR